MRKFAAAFSEPWRTSPVRFVFQCAAGGLFSYHLFHRFCDLPFVKDGQWIKEFALAALGFALGTIVNVVLHELGHAFAALIQKCPIYTVEIGLGATIVDFRWGKLPFHIRSYPTSGIVRWGYNSQKHPRLQRAFVTFGGMAVTLSLLVAAIVAFDAMDFRHAIFSSGRWLVAFWTGVIGSTICLFAGSWIPFYTQREGRRLATDALSIMRLPWISNDELQEAVRAVQLNLEVQKVLDPRIKTVEEATTNAANHPGDLKGLFTACHHLHAKGNPEAMRYAREALALPAEDQMVRHLLLDYLITIGLDHNLLSSEPGGRALLQESFESDRTGIGNIATYAAGLIDFDEDEVGSKMLEDVVKRSKYPINLAYSQLFLAISKRKRGLLDEARHHAKLASAYYPQCPGLKRVSELLEKAAG